MIDKVETDLEAVSVIEGDTTRGDPAQVEMKGHVPPVILGRHVGQLDLPDDLRPKMQRVLGSRPTLERQAGKIGNISGRARMS
jgi:hypothetical protein